MNLRLLSNISMNRQPLHKKSGKGKRIEFTLMAQVQLVHLSWVWRQWLNRMVIECTKQTSNSWRDNRPITNILSSLPKSTLKRRCQLFKKRSIDSSWIERKNCWVIFRVGLNMSRVTKKEVIHPLHKPWYSASTVWVSSLKMRRIRWICQRSYMTNKRDR